jgi:hypothetical protein
MNTRLALELVAAAPRLSCADALPGPARIWWMRTSARKPTLWALAHEARVQAPVQTGASRRISLPERAQPVA